MLEIVLHNYKFCFVLLIITTVCADERLYLFSLSMIQPTIKQKSKGGYKTHKKAKIKTRISKLRASLNITFVLTCI